MYMVMCSLTCVVCRIVCLPGKLSWILRFISSRVGQVKVGCLGVPNNNVRYLRYLKVDTLMLAY